MRIATSVLLQLSLIGVSAAAQAPATDRSGAAQQFKWGPAPAVFPAGAEMAVLAGNPGGQGEYTVRLRMPGGYKIAPHTHPTDENVTVISGTFKVGMGKTFETKGMMALSAGGFVTAPAQMAHYATAVGPTVVQVHGVGPFVLTYVNPADMPKPGSSTPK
jgi:quercetin dioxygenase-like cupin family protein